MDWMRYKLVYFTVSAAVICMGVYGLVVWGLPLGVDFRGGTIIEYKFEKEISTEEFTKELESEGVSVSAIQSTGPQTYLIKLPPVDEDQKLKIASVSSRILVEDGQEEATPSADVGETTQIEELRFETVGPSVGPELVKKTIYAILIAAGAIMLWVAYQFKSIKFGTSAILAMFHDSFILVGSFAVLGHFMDAEVDFLFVTALLTTLSFSVHDTIVVYDRIRESQKEYSDNMYDLANKAITETMVRSLNNSFTIMFMLAALMLLGGTTIKWFAAALFIGTILGTYSSPFVAVPLLVTWDSFFGRIRGVLGRVYSSKILNKIKRT
jgi:preprotein translocase subunit SecF